MNAKGRASAKKQGHNLKPPQPGGGPRKRSFCARMSGMPGPMKKPNGEPTRKALSLREMEVLMAEKEFWEKKQPKKKKVRAKKLTPTQIKKAKAKFDVYPSAVANAWAKNQ